ncbi:MAG: hypothetical protein M3Z00_10955 [Actinomycetota bacterium]|nr:hypothetical protein [Actinomycetota bacterium]
MSGDLESLIVQTWNFDDPAGSATAFAALADHAGSVADAIVLRTQQARAIGLGGDFRSAAELLDECDRFLSVVDDGVGTEHAAARIAIERGRVRGSTEDAAGARPLFERARALSLAAGLPGLALDALHMLAIVAGDLDGPAAAMTINRQGIAEAQASSDPAATRWLGSLLNNLGADLFDVGRPADALPVFEQALQARIDAGQTDRVAEAKAAIDEVRIALGSAG